MKVQRVSHSEILTLKPTAGLFGRLWNSCPGVAVAIHVNTLTSRLGSPAALPSDMTDRSYSKFWKLYHENHKGRERMIINKTLHTWSKLQQKKQQYNN